MRTKKVTAHFAVIFLQKLVTGKIVSLTKPPSTCLGMLTHITLESEEAAIHSDRRYKRQFHVPSVLCSIQTKSVQAFLIARYTVNVVLCL
jgi:hypothetical protein